MLFESMGKLTSLNGSEELFVMQNGVPKRLGLEDLANAQPDANGIYPDVPLNRVEIKRISAQSSTLVTLSGNVGMVAKMFAQCHPVLLDVNSKIAAYLNGSNTTKTADGANAPLGDPTLQEMARMGGYWKKYEYDASTNTKIEKYSIYKVRGYRYVRRRFIGMKSGTVQNGKLLSISGVWSTQNLSTQQFHNYAKALGDHYREIAMQDMEVFRTLFFLLKKTYNSQSIYTGVTTVDWTWWGTFANSENTKTTYGQFFKNGYMNDVAGHEGQKTLSVSNAGGTAKTVYPTKFLWCEWFMAGFWIWGTGRIHKDGVWYEFKDLSKIAFTVTADATPVCNVVNKGTAVSGGYIMECFEDTMIPTQVGGSTSTGLCDATWTGVSAGTVYVPAVVGSADAGSLCGVSALSSDLDASNAAPYYGGCLASDDPTDTIADGTVAA